jgi:hypothetical protein
MSNRLYCTLTEVIHDLGLIGNEPGLIDRIAQASAYIDRHIGNFIPFTATRYYQGNGQNDLNIDFLLGLTSLTWDTTTLTNNIDFLLQPLNRHWDNGPYSSIEKLYGSWGSDLHTVTIAGRWGLYEETSALAVTVTQADTSGTALAVANGSSISPGMNLLIGTEQEAVTDYGALTTATSKIDMALDMDNEDELITVDNGAEFFEGETIRVGSEDMFIRRITANVLDVSRGWNSTAKAAHLNNDSIYIYRTFTVVRGANGTTAALHSGAVVYRYITPWDVNWLCRQIAGLMRMKAKAGFAGKTGNVEMGETFYTNEFPDQIKKIQQNYRVVRL